MNSGNETPLFRFLLVFISGILLAVYFPVIPTFVSECFVGFSLTAFFILFNWKIKNVYRNRWIAPITGLLFTFFSGYLLTDLGNDKNDSSHFRNHPHRKGYVGFISQP